MPTTSRDFAAMEARRLQAARLFARGESQVAVARTLGVTRVSAHHWYHAWKKRGRTGVKGAGGAGRRGHTPVLTHVGGAWKRLSVAAALAFRWDGRRTRFFFHTQPGAYTDRTLIAFLRQLKRHFGRQPVILIWDGLPAHKSRVMLGYLARARQWLSVERLPAYAPDLNPVEPIWGNLKRRELANLCAPDLPALRTPLRRGCAR